MTQDLAALVAALRTQRQIDMDGCEVAVSRQACDEAADALEAQAAEIARLTAALNEADACNKGLVRLNEALQQRAEKAEADRDKWFEGAGAHHVASMREAQRADQNAARAEKAEAALTESQAREAAAFEVAAMALDHVASNWDCGHMASRLCDCARDAEQWGIAADEVRALIPADAQAALDARDKAKVEEGRIAGLREAAELIAGEDHTREELKRGRLQAPGVLARAYDAILAKIKEAE